MAKEKRSETQADFNLKDYQFHGLGMLILIPPLFWVSSSINPLTETWHFMIGIQSNKTAVISFIIVVLSIYASVVTFIKRIIGKNNRSNKDVTPSITEVKNKEVAEVNTQLGSVFGASKGYSKPIEEKKKVIVTQEEPISKSSELPPIPKNSKGEGDIILIPSKTEYKIDELTKRLIQKLNSATVINEGDKATLGNLMNIIHEKTEERLKTKAKSSALSSNQQAMFIDKNKYTEEEIKALEGDLANNAITRPGGLKSIDRSGIKDLFITKKQTKIIQ